MLLFSGGGVACVHTMKVINSNRQNFMVETQPMRALSHKTKKIERLRDVVSQWLNC